MSEGPDETLHAVDPDGQESASTGAGEHQAAQSPADQGRDDQDAEPASEPSGAAAADDEADQDAEPASEPSGAAEDEAQGRS